LLYERQGEERRGGGRGEARVREKREYIAEVNGALTAFKILILSHLGGEVKVK
jgi:hypothetical protein